MPPEGKRWRAATATGCPKEPLQRALVAAAEWPVD
jgi:hypothetical protein